jgi:hypothetical protein
VRHYAVTSFNLKEAWNRNQKEIHELYNSYGEKFQWVKEFWIRNVLKTDMERVCCKKETLDIKYCAE